MNRGPRSVLCTSVRQAKVEHLQMTLLEDDFLEFLAPVSRIYYFSLGENSSSALNMQLLKIYFMRSEELGVIESTFKIFTCISVLLKTSPQLDNIASIYS